MTRGCLQTVILNFSRLSFPLFLCYILCIIPAHSLVLVFTALWLLHVFIMAVLFLLVSVPGLHVLITTAFDAGVVKGT